MLPNLGTNWQAATEYANSVFDDLLHSHLSHVDVAIERRWDYDGHGNC